MRRELNQSEPPPAVRRHGLTALRAQNLSTLLELVWERGPISRPELMSVTSLAPSSVIRLTQDLVALGLIRESGKGRSSGGRQPQLIEASGLAGYVIGVDLSGVELRAGAFDTANRQLGVVIEPLDGVGQGPIEAQLVRVIESVRESVGARRRLLGIGLSIPGTVDSANGIILEAYNLRLVNIRIRDSLAPRFGVPVVVEHDASVGAIAERAYGAGRGFDDVIYVLVASGIGSGIILGGRVYAGRTGRSGQLGHLIIERGGPQCVCGRQGCLEAIAAGPAIAANARRVAEGAPGTALAALSGSSIDVGAVVQAANAGDRIAAGILAQSADALAIGIASLARLFDVERVIVGGEVIEDSTTYFEELHVSVERYIGQLGRVTLSRGSLRQGEHIRGLSRLTIEQSVRTLLLAPAASAS
jgi:predicted NBD/HSP70 family sugar kinase